MAYLIGNDLESGIVRPTLPRKPSLPGKPVGLRARPTLEDVDPDMADRLRYTQSVYGGDAAQIYQAHRAAIDAQFDYTMQRALTGKELVPVADPAWNPSQYDNDTNDAIVLWYKQHGNTGPAANSPTTSARTFFNPSSHSTGGADTSEKNTCSRRSNSMALIPRARCLPVLAPAAPGTPASPGQRRLPSNGRTTLRRLPPKTRTSQHHNMRPATTGSRSQPRPRKAQKQTSHSRSQPIKPTQFRILQMC